MIRGRAAAVCICVLWLSAFAFGGATVTIINVNAPGVGFNDPTPATPVGGNNGTTVGEQRLIAFQFAANIWGANLNSTVEIKVNARFIGLSCTANSGVLGSAGATQSRANFANAEFTGTWYPITLANARAGTDIVSPAGTAHISADFNSDVGTTNCLAGSGWYYGLDTNGPANKVNLVAVVLHELGHGMGFSLGPTSLTSGAWAQGLPGIYERKIFDNTTGKNWLDMTDTERVASAINPGNVVWTGAQVLAAAPNVLSGTPILQITAPEVIAGTYSVGTAVFGAALTGSPVTGQLLVANDGAASGSTTDGCETITNAGAISGKIAVVDRGQCTFKLKAKNVQDAGAIGVVVVNNVAGAPIGMADDGSITATITIPVVMVSDTNGAAIKNQLAIPVTVSGFMGLNLNQLAGADSQGRPKLYTPNPLEQGSSISHWDTSALPNQLMEPNISSDLTHSVKPPQDLTLPLLADLGWTVAGLTVRAEIFPNPLPFGNKLIGIGTYSTNVRFTNTGATPVNISSVTLSGSAEFSRTNNCPASLAAAASCTVIVSYTPVAQAQQTGTLSIASDATGSPHTVAISGTGVTTLVLSLARPVRPPRNGLGQGQSLEFEVLASGVGETAELVKFSCIAGAGVQCAVTPEAGGASGGVASARITIANPGRSRRLRASGTRTVEVKVMAAHGGIMRVLSVPVTVQR